MKKTLLILCLLASIIKTHSQNSILPDSRFETFEKIKLGNTKIQFEKSMTNLGIKKMKFFTNMLASKPNEINPVVNIIELFYSDKFDFDEFKFSKNAISHPTLIYPESMDNKIVTSITLLLGHTANVLFLDKADSIKNKNIPQFRQDINQELFFKIVDLYSLKYGNPIMKMDTTVAIKYYMLYENYIKHDTQEKYNNYILSWNLEYYTIEVFPGFNLNAYYIPQKWYSNSTNWLRSNLDDDELDSNQKACFTVPFIRYTLNNRGLKYIGVNKISL